MLQPSDCILERGQMSVLEVCNGWVKRPARFGYIASRPQAASSLLLRRQPHVKLNSHFILGSDARFSGRLDPEIGLLHGGLAPVTAILQGHVHRDWARLSAQRQIST